MIKILRRIVPKEVSDFRRSPIHSMINQEVKDQDRPRLAEATLGYCLLLRKLIAEAISGKVMRQRLVYPRG